MYNNVKKQRYKNKQFGNTGLPTKDETSETIVRNFLVRFHAFRVPCRPKLAYFCA